MVLPAKKYYTPEEYLALEETTEYKSEYYNGEIFQMAGGMPDHSQIGLNTGATLRAALRGSDCRAYSSDQKLFVSAHNLYAYPDVSIYCGPRQFAPNRRDIMINPTLLGEVLSESTARYDRTTKFSFYRSINTLQIYLLIDSTRVFVECYQKNQSNEWVYSAYSNIEERITLNALGIELALAEIYEDIQFDSEAEQTEGHEA